MYPRKTEEGKLVADDQIVGAGEHLLYKHRIIALEGVMTGATTASTYLLAMDSVSQEPIKIIITSPGGELDSAFLLYDTIKLLKSPVWTLGRYCASAAVLILAAGATRFLMPHAKTMLHLPSGQMTGDSRDLSIQHAQMVFYQDRLFEIFEECGVKKSREEILADIDRDFWLDPQEAIEYGLADEVLTKEALGEWLK